MTKDMTDPGRANPGNQCRTPHQDGVAHLAEWSTKTTGVYGGERWRTWRCTISRRADEDPAHQSWL